MNLMHSGFLFVLFVIVEAITGLPPDNSKTNSKDLPTIHTVTEKSQQDSGVSESVKIIVPTEPQIVTNATTTDGNKTTSTSTTPVTTPPTTPPTPKTTTTTPPTPTPVPPPEKGTWIIRNNATKTVCIIAEMVMQLNITYPGKSKPQQHDILNIPKNSTVNGSCSEPLQNLIIHWGPGHSLRINFSVNKTSKNFYVSGLSLSVNATVLKDAKVDNETFWNFENKSSEFFTPLDMSYKCSKVQDFDLNGADEKLKAVLSLKDTQLEAYMNKTKVEFEAAQNCDTFDTPDIVPIAVGCALAVLVFVVLVAYLIGRKRSQNRGYLSM